MENPVSGSCLCNAVAFEVRGPFESFFLCHCARCRKDTGSDHAANLFSSKARITWMRGQSKIRTFRLAGTRHQKCFCSECGSALPMLQMDGALLVVPAGSLDSPIEIRPDARICYASRAEWTDWSASARIIDGLPE